MSTYSAIIDSGLTSAEGFNKALSQLLGNEGIPTITTPSALQVVQRGAGANMSVDVSIGSSLISNSTATYGYAAWQDAVSNVTISAANPSNPRIDAIVAYINLAAVSTSQNNNPGSLVFTAIAGTPGASPSAPSDSTIQSTLGANVPWTRLANVTVAANATQIVTANIADVRSPFAVRANLWGGSSNTFGHTVPNAADDTVALLNTAQSPTNKTISGTTNKVRAGGGSSSLVDSNSIQIDLEQQRTEHEFNYVASGCVWSGDSYGSTLNASMTSGVVYIAGRRLTVAAVTSRAFTASKDTYVDFQDNGDGTAHIYYTEVTNNAASPALANSGTTANTIRDAKIVSGASSIASAASIAQSGTDTLYNIFRPAGPFSPVRIQNPYKFSVYRAAALTSSVTATAVPFDTKTFDTGNNVDIVTNKGRFTVPIAGFYQFFAQVVVTQTGNLYVLASIAKNGAAVAINEQSGTNTPLNATVSALLSLAANDYVEVYLQTQNAVSVTTGNALSTYFYGYLVSAT